MEKTLNPWPQALLATPSLTAALKATGADFAVRVRFQGEVAAEDLFSHERFAACHYVREVHLLLAGVAVVWARSVCAADALLWREVLDCGEQPLGARLCGGVLSAQRSDFTYFAGNVPEEAGEVWQRCSCFTLGDERLLLTEAFLPALTDFYKW